MTVKQFVIRRYLAPPDPGFWRWDHDGEAVLWSDGGVLAFRKEVVEVLDELAVEGLPPLSAVLLVMAAARRSWGNGQRALQSLTNLAGRFGDARRQLSPSFLQDVMAGLDAVRQAREDLADTYPPSRLAALIMSDVARELDASSAKDVVAALRAGPDRETLAPCSDRDLYVDLLHCLNLLRERLVDVSAQALRLIDRTGLDRTVTAPAEAIELEPMPSRARTLIEQLRHDEEYAPIARLSRALMAAFHLPRAMADPQHMPLGGVSDITNRGELDRLLISELAHDDMTLAVRIANNEALYLRREDPPSTPTRQRHILLDTGIRMWGVPRLLATSAALALLASSESSEAFAWSAQHGGLAEAKLGDREGMIEHLSRLDASLTPAALLGPLLDRIAGSGDSDESCADVVVITSAAAATDPQFIRQMRSLRPHQIHLMGVRRDGEVNLFSVTETGVRPMRKLRMELDDLMDTGLSPRRQIMRDVDPGLPAFFKVSPSPLRVGGRIDPRFVWCADHGPALTLTRDGRLLLWEDLRRGPQMLRDDLLGLHLLWADTRSRESAHALLGSPSTWVMSHLLMDLTQQRTSRLDLQVPREHGPLRGATVHRDHALLFHRRAITALNLHTGSEVCHHVTNMEIKENFGRVIRMGRHHWSMVSFEGRIHVENLRRPNQHVIGCFESTGLGATVVVNPDNTVWIDNGGKERHIHDGEAASRWIGLKGVSWDGRRFCVRHLRNGREGASVYSIDTDRLQMIGKEVNDVSLALEQPAWEHIHERSRRSRFDFAMIHADNGILQLGLRGRHARIVIAPVRGHMMLQQTTQDGSLKPFEVIAAPLNTGYKLKAATWPDGSRIVHDARGLLHLQSSDHTLPEATIVLAADEPLSGWLGDGRCWGDAYYAQGERTNPEFVYRTVIERFLRKLS